MSLPHGEEPFHWQRTLLDTLLDAKIPEAQYEELGSGVRRVNQYLPHYAPAAGKPFFEDGDIFRVIVPLSVEAAEITPQVAGEVNGEVTGEVLRLLAACEGVLPRQKLQTRIGIRHDEHFRLAYMTPALAAGLIEMTIPDKPRSRLQKYHLTDKGRAVLMKAKES